MRVVDAGRWQRRETTSYVGRSREVAEARRVLSQARLVTLTGPGGVGKTRLALRVTREISGDFGDGAVLVELAELRDAALLPDHVAHRLGVPDQAGRSAVQGVVDQLRDREVLLLVDNCEHLVEACADLLDAVLESCPRVTVLATSRQSLGLAGERTVRVQPLAVPDAPEDALDVLARNESVRLFIDRATAVWPGFRLTESNCADVAWLCGQLDGVPLAIELAAARIRSLSARQIAERLGSSLSLLTTGRRSGPLRQRTLRSTIEWSYELCSPAEQSVWDRVSVFAGTFDLPAAEHVCESSDVDVDAVADLIDGLVDKSVILRADEGDAARYRMLDTLREFGQCRLEQSGAAGEAARRHRDWYDQLTARADAEWLRSGQSDWVLRLRLEHANLRAALNWSISEPGEVGAALRMACRVDEYWTMIGRTAEARMWLDRALATAPADHPCRAAALIVWAMHGLGMSEVREASARLDEAEELIGEGDELLRAHIRSLRLLEAMILQDPAALVVAEGVAQTLRAHGEHRNEFRVMVMQAIVAAYVGDLEGGRKTLRQVIERAEAAGGIYYRDMALFGLTLIEVRFGDLDVAAESARTALASTSEIDSLYGDAFHLETLAWVAHRRGEQIRAATLFGAAATAWEALGTAAMGVVVRPHREYEQATREALGETRFETAYAAGRALSKSDARGYALDRSSPGERPLTGRELEIAELIAEGLRNREIADRLVIAPRTAETHVQHILTKLGFTNRAQIAAWLVTQRTHLA